MGKGPEFFPGWIPSRGATSHSATRLSAAGRAGKGKSHPNGRHGEKKGQKGGVVPARGERSPAEGAAGPGGCGFGAATPERFSPHPAVLSPNPGGTFPAWLLFFLLCFVLEAKAFESPSRSGIKVSFFKSY